MWFYQPPIAHLCSRNEPVEGCAGWANHQVGFDLHITAALQVPEGVTVKICHQLPGTGSVGRERDPKMHLLISLKHRNSTYTQIQTL